MDAFFTSSEMMVRPQRSTIPLCGACGLLTQCKSPKMKTSGKGRRKFLIVGESPGAEEDKDGIQFVGKAGRRLQRTLDDVGFDMRQEAWITNALICRPLDNKMSKKEIDYCRPNLVKTVGELQPEVIILLGGSAVRSLIDYVWKDDDIGGINRWAGFRIPCQKLNAWIAPTFHPSFLLRTEGKPGDRVYDAMFEQHLANAVALSGRPWPDGSPDNEGQVDVILNAEDAASRVRKYRAGLVAFDFEHNPLKPDNDRISDLVCCSICWEGEETISFPWIGPVKEEVKSLLLNREIGKIASNMKNEDRWCQSYLGIRVVGWAWDTMLAAHALDPRGGITSIKFQSFVRLGAPSYNDHIEPFLIPREKGGYAENRVREVKMEHLLRYCGLDSLYEFHVAKHQAIEMGVDL
jgi:uracil-DNA glycosylase family 4